MKLTKRDLKILIQEGEGQRIEFKEAVSSSVTKDLVAFANDLGGKILIGVDDSGKIKGIKATNSLKSEITTLARNCDPAVKIDLHVIDNVIIVNVDEGDNKPYQCKEGFFIRQGANSQKLTRNQIIQFYIDEGRVRFDTQLNPKFQYPKDFHKGKLKQFLKAIKMSTTHKAEDVLLNLGVAEKRQENILLNNTGVLLFARQPCKFFQSAYVDAVVFKGIDRVDVIDRKTYKGGLFENFEDVYTYLHEHLNVRYEYGHGLRRRNIYEIPLDALREALVNALIHRDYFMTGANISVCIFDDRVEVVSPGGLPKPLTVADLGTKSKRRNENIADLFSRLEYVEKLGTGIKKIRRWMKEQGLKPPKIEVGGFFTMTFKRPEMYVHKMSVKDVGKMSVKNVGKKERKKFIISKILNGESFTFITLAKELGVNDKTIERDIEGLKTTKIIRFVGSKRSGHYELVGGGQKSSQKGVARRPGQNTPTKP